MNYALLGATGLIGASVLEILERDESCTSLIVLARRPAPRPLAAKIEWRVVDFDSAKAFQELGGVDTALCCIGTTMKVAGSREAFRRVDHDYPLAFARALAESPTVFSLVSSVGADPHAGTFYLRVKGELEAAVNALPLPSVHCLRPSLLLGDRAEKRTLERMAGASFGAMGGMLVGGLSRYRAIAGSTVAAAMVALAKSERSGRHIWHYRELVAAAQPAR